MQSTTHISPFLTIESPVAQWLLECLARLQRAVEHLELVRFSNWCNFYIYPYNKVKEYKKSTLETTTNHLKGCPSFSLISL